MKTAEKLKNSYSINLDDPTAQQLETLAEYYQRKPRELLRLLLAPALRDLWARMQQEQHPENKAAPVVATFQKLRS